MDEHTQIQSSARGPLDWLLEEEGVRSLPAGLPIDLARLPLVRPTNVLDEKLRTEDGRLPQEVWEVEVDYVDDTGARQQAIVRGSPTEGLPYGADGDALLATCLLVVEDGNAEGYVENPSLNRLVASLGREWDGQQGKRMMEALSRLASVVIETTMEETKEEEVKSLLAGEKDPSSPRPVHRRRARQVKIKLLNLDWEMESLQMADGSSSERVRIRELQLAPQLLRYAIGGGVAWIDRDVFIRLSRQPIARALYLYAASEVATGRTAPWRYDLDTLSMALGLRLDTRPARRAKQLEEAAEALKAEGVLESYKVEGRGRKVSMSLQRGERLDIARRLRGVGLLEMVDLRKQVVLLGMMGVNSARAREIVRQAGRDLPSVLAYLKYKAETEPAAQEISNPAGFVVRAIQRGISFDSDDRFVRWLEERINSSHQEQGEKGHGQMRGEPGVGAASIPAISSPTQVPSTLPETGPTREVEERAAEIWGNMRAEAETLLDSALGRALMGAIFPWKIEGNTLYLQSSNTYAASYLSERLVRPLSDLLRKDGTGGDGKLERLRIEVIS